MTFKAIYVYERITAYNEAKKEFAFRKNLLELKAQIQLTYKFGNRSPAPHFRPIRSPGIANYSQETSLNEPGALDERLRTLVMQSFERGGERL